MAAANRFEHLKVALAGRYSLVRELGRGGMATVYLAQDFRHDRPVALKVLHPELAATLGPERFLRETKLTARLQHPHILPVFDGVGPERRSAWAESRARLRAASTPSALPPWSPELPAR